MAVMFYAFCKHSVVLKGMWYSYLKAGEKLSIHGFPLLFTSHIVVSGANPHSLGLRSFSSGAVSCPRHEGANILLTPKHS